MRRKSGSSSCSRPRRSGDSRRLWCWHRWWPKARRSSPGDAPAPPWRGLRLPPSVLTISTFSPRIRKRPASRAIQSGNMLTVGAVMPTRKVSCAATGTSGETEDRAQRRTDEMDGSHGLSGVQAKSLTGKSHPGQLGRRELVPIIWGSVPRWSQAHAPKTRVDSSQRNPVGGLSSGICHGRSACESVSRPARTFRTGRQMGPIRWPPLTKTQARLAFLRDPKASAEAQGHLPLPPPAAKSDDQLRLSSFVTKRRALKRWAVPSLHRARRNRTTVPSRSFATIERVLKRRALPPFRRARRNRSPTTAHRRIRRGLPFATAKTRTMAP